MLAYRPWTNLLRCTRTMPGIIHQGIQDSDDFQSGEGGIRTPGAGITDATVFETAALVHSATSPPGSLTQE